MNQERLLELVDKYRDGIIIQEEFTSLQTELASNPVSRAAFRELVDLEIALGSWVERQTDDVALDARRTFDSRSPGLHVSKRFAPSRQTTIWILIAAALLPCVFAAIWFADYLGRQRDHRGQHTETAKQSEDVRSENTFGTIRFLSDNIWSDKTGLQGDDQFAAGLIGLVSGVAQLEFKSGTTMIIEGPCRLMINSAKSAELQTGKSVINVSELSDGFVLLTPDVEIIDEGTEYAVSTNDEFTEVHVFDGAVVSHPLVEVDGIQSQRIEAGHASRFFRLNSKGVRRIPFGKRQFVRKLESNVRIESSGDLIAYDGFENLAGRLRTGRSGFGWAGGWNPPGRRKQNGKVIDAPGDRVFGIDRSDRRLLLLPDGISIERRLENPLLQDETSVYISFLLRLHSQPTSDQSFKMSIVSSMKGGRHGQRAGTGIAFGISDERFPFTKNAHEIKKVATPIPLNQPILCVAKIQRTKNQRDVIKIRIYQSFEALDVIEPTLWTVSSEPGISNNDLSKVQISSDRNSSWEVDELKIGKTWASVLPNEAGNSMECP